MIGSVLEYNAVAKVGYILGYDDITYFFRQSDVKKNIILKKGNIVEFDYLPYNNEMPSAVRIEKREI